MLPKLTPERKSSYLFNVSNKHSGCRQMVQTLVVNDQSVYTIYWRYTNHLTLKMTSAQVVETSVNVILKRPCQGYKSLPGRINYDMTPGFKPLTIITCTTTLEWTDRAPNSNKSRACIHRPLDLVSDCWSPCTPLKTPGHYATEHFFFTQLSKLKEPVLKANTFIIILLPQQYRPNLVTSCIAGK